VEGVTKVAVAAATVAVAAPGTAAEAAVTEGLAEEDTVLTATARVALVQWESQAEVARPGVVAFLSPLATASQLPATRLRRRTVPTAGLRGAETSRVGAIPRPATILSRRATEDTAHLQSGGSTVRALAEAISTVPTQQAPGARARQRLRLATVRAFVRVCVRVCRCDLRSCG
jgi:hypothetical protein